MVANIRHTLIWWVHVDHIARNSHLENISKIFRIKSNFIFENIRNSFDIRC